MVYNKKRDFELRQLDPQQQQQSKKKTKNSEKPWQKDFNDFKQGVSDQFNEFIASLRSIVADGMKGKSSKSKGKRSDSSDDESETAFTGTLRFFSDKVAAAKERYQVFLKSKGGSWRSSKGCLDSGAETSAGIVERHEQYCRDVRKVPKGTVSLKPWNSKKVMEPTKVGYMPVKIGFYEGGEQKSYEFEHLVKVYLVPEEDMKLGTKDIDLLIGEPAIEREKITPIDALKSKVKDKEKKRDNRKSKSRNDRR